MPLSLLTRYTPTESNMYFANSVTIDFNGSYITEQATSSVMEPVM
jgi:hypothetical protein